MLLALAALLTSGCSTPAIGPAPQAETPTRFHEAAADTTNGLPMPADGRWWQVLADPALDPLIQRASSGNLGLQQALARVAQARALARAAGAQQMPQAGLVAGASQQGGPLVNAAGSSGSLINIGASLSYELDLFGRGQQQATAAKLDLQATDALARAAQLQLQAQVAHTVLGLRGLADELALLQATQQAWQDTLALQQRRQQAGLAPAQQAARLRAEAGAAATEALLLQQRQTQLLHSLALLLGEDNRTAALSAGLLTPVQVGAAPIPDIPAGLPASMLQRRPDIAAALHKLQAAQQRLGLARSAWLPSLSLTASGGRASSQLADLLLGSARSWGLAGLLTAPLLDGGRRAAATDQAAADLDLATLAWREQVLVALHEVDDQLANLRHLAAQADERQQTAAAADQAERLTAALQQRGLVSQLEVLDARRQALAERRAALQLHTARRQASVALVRALGGGWGPAAVDAGAIAGAAPETVAGTDAKLGHASVAGAAGAAGALAATNANGANGAKGAVGVLGADAVRGAAAASATQQPGRAAAAASPSNAPVAVVTAASPSNVPGAVATATTASPPQR